jgi:hypothetical protein
MSDCSNSNSAIDSDSDYGEGHVSGTRVGSGNRNTSSSSSVNETQGSDPSPPKALAKYAKGTFDKCTTAKGCLQSQYKITMWEDKGVHDMDRIRPHKLQSPLHKIHAMCPNRCMPRPPILSRTRDIETRNKGTNHDRTSLGVHYKIIHYGLHGFDLHPWAYNSVAK